MKVKFSRPLHRKRVMVAAILSAGLISGSYAQDNQDPDFVTQSCPVDFYQLPLYPNAKLCQMFAQQLPASLIYYADADQQTTQQFYLQNMGEADQVKTIKGRIQMEYGSANKIIIISKDGNGSQVDILVKSAADV